MEKSRLSDVKVAFIIGLNEGVLPAKFQKMEFLRIMIVRIFLATGLKIAPSSKTRLLDEEFLAYRAFVTPSESLIYKLPASK